MFSPKKHRHPLDSQEFVRQALHHHDPASPQAIQERAKLQYSPLLQWYQEGQPLSNEQSSGKRVYPINEIKERDEHLEEATVKKEERPAGNALIGRHPMCSNSFAYQALGQAARCSLEQQNFGPRRKSAEIPQEEVPKHRQVNAKRNSSSLNLGEEEEPSCVSKRESQIAPHQLSNIVLGDNGREEQSRGRCESDVFNFLGGEARATIHGQFEEDALKQSYNVRNRLSHYKREHAGSLTTSLLPQKEEPHVPAPRQSDGSTRVMEEESNPNKVHHDSVKRHYAVANRTSSSWHQWNMAGSRFNPSSRVSAC